MLRPPSPQTDARIVEAVKAGKRDEAVRLFLQDSDGTPGHAAVRIEEIEAWLKGRKTPSSLAMELCNLVRDGKLTDHQAYQRMKRECPGFSRAAYDQALEQGYFESR